MNTLLPTLPFVSHQTHGLGTLKAATRVGRMKKGVLFTKEPMDLQGIGTAGNQIREPLFPQHRTHQDKMMGFCL